MFGGKLRSWMEAVRSKKKQQKKDKSKKNISSNDSFDSSNKKIEAVNTPSKHGVSTYLIKRIIYKIIF